MAKDYFAGLFGETLVLEFLDGGSLRQKLDGAGRLSEKDMVCMAYQVLTALDYAHCQDIVHRDIKPENVRGLIGSLHDLASSSYLKWRSVSGTAGCRRLRYAR